VLANRLLVAQLANLARLVVLALFGAPRGLPRLHDCLLRLARPFHLKHKSILDFGRSDNR